MKYILYKLGLIWCHIKNRCHWAYANGRINGYVKGFMEGGARWCRENGFDAKAINILKFKHMLLSDEKFTCSRVKDAYILDLLTSMDSKLMHSPYVDEWHSSRIRTRLVRCGAVSWFC